MVVNHCQKCGAQNSIIEEDGDLFCRKCFWHIKQKKLNKTKPTDQSYRNEVSEKKCGLCGGTFLLRWRQEYCPDCLKERKRIACREFRKRHKDNFIIQSNWEN